MVRVVSWRLWRACLGRPHTFAELSETGRLREGCDFDRVPRRRRKEASELQKTMSFNYFRDLQRELSYCDKYDEVQPRQQLTNNLESLILELATLVGSAFLGV